VTTASLLKHIVDILFWFWYVLLLLRVLLSWLRLPPRHWVNAWLGPFVYAITEPLLRPIRRVLARHLRGTPLDFSPLIAYLLLEIVHTLTTRLLLL